MDMVPNQVKDITRAAKQSKMDSYIKVSIAALWR